MDLPLQWLQVTKMVIALLSAHTHHTYPHCVWRVCFSRQFPCRAFMCTLHVILCCLRMWSYCDDNHVGYRSCACNAVHIHSVGLGSSSWSKQSERSYTYIYWSPIVYVYLNVKYSRKLRAGIGGVLHMYTKHQPYVTCPIETIITSRNQIST